MGDRPVVHDELGLPDLGSKCRARCHAVVFVTPLAHVASSDDLGRGLLQRFRHRKHLPNLGCMLPKVSLLRAPTGGPNSGLDPWRRRRVARALSVASCAALSYSGWSASASATPELRVTGSSTIEASAALQRGGCEVAARLLDDAGHPVSGAELRLELLNPGAEPPTARECRSKSGELAHDSAFTYGVRTNDAGALCVHFDGIPDRPEFELSFTDPSGLYTATTRRILGDRATRSVELAFAPSQTVLALERASQVLSLVTRPEPALAAGEAVETLGITLSAARDGAPPKPIGMTSVEIGSSAELRIPSLSFGTPGPLELSAEFPGSESTRAARSVLHVTSTALVVLSLARPVAASHPEHGVSLQVRVMSVAGAVPSGSVEARIGGLSLGSARVADGNAELELRVEEAQVRARPVELRYVPDSNWWLPGAGLAVEIPIAPPSPWHRFAWIAAVAALSSWLLIGWQRPRRMERVPPSAENREGVRVPVDVLELGAARAGWRGRVIDAHDGRPIPGAAVLVRLPAFDASGVLRTAHTDADGSFTLEGGEAAGPGAALEVRAPFHSALAAPMPPPGTLVLSLVSRRRTLLARFVEWATHDGGWERRVEATPGELARRSERADVAAWAHAVEEAAFGPDPLSEAKEQGVSGREPAHRRKPA